MDDKRYNNDGYVETPMPETHTEPAYDYSSEFTRRRRFPWVRLALVLIILGVGLSAVGLLSGARGGYFYFQNGRLRVSTSGDDESGSVSMEAYHFHSINIHTTSSRVIIVPGDSHRVVVPSAAQRTPVVSVDNGTLNIRRRDTGGTANLFLFNVGISPSVNDEIRVYVPNHMSDITVRTSSGRIQIDGISANNIYANSSSGRVEVSNVTTPMHINLRSSSGRVSVENIEAAIDIYLQTSSGRIDIDNVDWHNNLTARASSGRINVANGRNTGAGHTSLQTSSGAIYAEIIGNRSDFQYSLNTSSGSMRVDGDRLSGRSAGGGQGANEINLRTSSGSIRLNFVR